MPAPRTELPKKGTLKRYPFPKLLREISRHEASGALYLMSGSRKKVVFFEEGEPIFVRSNVLEECLGRILAEEGIITDEQCEQTLEAIRRTGKKQGELLVEMGILSAGNLEYGLRAQLRRKLYDVFSWQDGRFQFKPGNADQSFGVRLRSTAEGTIVAAVQDRFDEGLATEALSAYATRYPVVREGVSSSGVSLDLLPEELHFLLSLDGSRSVDVLIAAQPEPPVPCLPALLYGVIQAGLVQLSLKKLRARRPPAPPQLVPDLDPEALKPAFEAVVTVTEYEDTPLPGELPTANEEDEAMTEFHHVDADDLAAIRGDSISKEILIEAEPEPVEQTFDADIEVLAEEAVEEIADDDLLMVDADDADEVDETEADSDSGSEEDELARLQALAEDLGGDDELADLDDLDDIDLGEALGTEPEPEPVAPQEPVETEAPPVADDGAGAAEAELLEADDDLALEDLEPDADLEDEAPLEDIAAAAAELEADDDLMGLDDLDDIDLGGGDPSAAPEEVIEDPSIEEVQDVEEIEAEDLDGPILYGDGEAALASGDYPRAIDLLTQAKEAGFEVAELHAMLGYALFKAGRDKQGQQAMGHLQEAEELDPALDLVHAYRGAIHHELGDDGAAKAALQQALDLNPYCDLAINILDQI